MFAYLILLFTILPAVELAILIKVGGHIGAGNTLMIIIFTGIAGASLARLQGFTVLRNIQDSLNKGEMPTDSMLDGVMIFCGGVVLLTPGFITDALGFMLLIPWTRSLIKYWARKRIQRAINSGQSMTLYSSLKKPSSRVNDQDYEDAEYY